MGQGPFPSSDLELCKTVGEKHPKRRGWEWAQLWEWMWNPEAS